MTSAPARDVVESLHHLVAAGLPLDLATAHVCVSDGVLHAQACSSAQGVPSIVPLADVLTAPLCNYCAEHLAVAVTNGGARKLRNWLAEGASLAEQRARLKATTSLAGTELPLVLEHIKELVSIPTRSTGRPSPALAAWCEEIERERRSLVATLLEQARAELEPTLVHALVSQTLMTPSHLAGPELAGMTTALTSQLEALTAELLSSPTRALVVFVEPATTAPALAVLREYYGVGTELFLVPLALVPWLRLRELGSVRDVVLVDSDVTDAQVETAVVLHADAGPGASLTTALAAACAL